MDQSRDDGERLKGRVHDRFIVSSIIQIHRKPYGLSNNNTMHMSMQLWTAPKFGPGYFFSWFADSMAARKMVIFVLFDYTVSARLQLSPPY
jgi:hypothetical protein